MPIIYMILLGLIVAYAIFLVLANSTAAVVNLLFYQSPAMNLGGLLLLVLGLGVLAGLLLGLMVFRVFQTRWELTRVRKELETVRSKHIQAAAAAAAASQGTLPPVGVVPNDPAPSLDKMPPR